MPIVTDSQPVIRLRTDGGERDFAVAGVYYDYGSDQGTVAISRATFNRYWDDGGVSSLGVYAASGINRGRLLARIKALSPRPSPS